MTRVKIGLMTTVAAALCAGAIAVAAVPSNEPPDRPGHVVDPNPAPFDRVAAQRERASRVPVADPSSRFAVLRRSRVAKDVLPSAWQPRSSVGTAQLRDVRLALTSPLGDVYAVPTDREICAISTYAKSSDGGASEACTPTADAASRGAMIVLQCIDGIHPSPQYVSGLIGDDVSAVRALNDGAEVAHATVTANAFQLVIDRPADTLEYADTGRKVPLPSAFC